MSDKSSNRPIPAGHRGHIPSLPPNLAGPPPHHPSRQRDPSWAQAHDGRQDTPVFQGHPGAMSGNHSWQPMLAHSSHHPMNYSGPPQYMSYSAPMTYVAPTSYQHSGPVYTGQPHYPYSAAPQSHFPPMGQPGPPYYHHPSMPIYAPLPSQQMFFPGHSEPTHWPIQTNGPHPPVNYGSRPCPAATSGQPSNPSAAPQLVFAYKPESLYAKTNGWYHVRQDLIHELDFNKIHWTRRFGSDDEYKRVRESLVVEANSISVPYDKWMERLDMGPVLANAYNRPIVFISDDVKIGCITNLPSLKDPDPKPLGPILIAFTRGNHWELVIPKRGLIPIPPLSFSFRTRLENASMAQWLTAIQPNVDLYHQLISQ
ncbi:hypothetical protein PGT21_012890 [Puccinia graminis f. sp. tritici]|uniref:OTU domain-containing protein n=1 Tax=Puccinia graminis f. sp. tritici TaxID=56615 RepID=A0A5B0QN63_PUCGR|nr:hypothetical protein PGT21_012890 [Puccinia graminis f. sp. tritici]